MIALSLLAFVLAVPAPTGSLQYVTGGDGQIWMCLSAEDGGAQLGTWSVDANTDQFGLVHKLPAKPMLFGAFGETVWFANVSGEGSQVDVRVLVFQAMWSLSRLDWITLPADGPSRLPLRSIDGTPRRLIGGQDGPVLLSTKPDKDTLQVSAYRHGQWLDWPALELGPAGTLESAASGVDLLALHVDADGSKHLSRLKDDGVAWDRLNVDVPHDATMVAWWGDTPVVGVQQDDRLDVWMIQGETLVRMAQGQLGSTSAWLVSDQGSVLQVREDGGVIQYSTLNTLREEGTPWIPLRAADASPMRLWSIIVTIAIGVSVLLVLVFGRSMEAMALPRGVRAAPLLTRFGAFAVDLIPGLIVVGLWWGIEIGTLVRAVMQGPMPGTLAPLLLVAGVCWVWQAGWEGLTGTSPGKRLGRLCVVNLHGRRPSWGRTIVRTGARSLIVLAVPLAIIIVLTATGQGLGDVLARTVVVRRLPQTPPAAS